MLLRAAGWDAALSDHHARLTETHCHQGQNSDHLSCVFHALLLGSSLQSSGTSQSLIRGASHKRALIVHSSHLLPSLLSPEVSPSVGTDPLLLH